MKKPSILRQWLFCGLLVISAAASADSPGPLRTEVTLSANGHFRVTVVPSPSGGSSLSQEDEGGRIASSDAGVSTIQTSPIAKIERRAEEGKWRLVRNIRLINDVAPRSVLLANDASFLVTFDNWLTAGYGDDVIAIYDRKGNLVRKLSLEQILPPAYLTHVPRSVSSRQWGSEHSLISDDRILELHLTPPGESTRVRSAHVPLRISLADGAAIKPGGAAWKRAMARVELLESQRIAAWESLRKVRASPLVPPFSWHTSDWRHYLFELRDRIAVEGERMVGMVLPAPGAAPAFRNAHDIEGWISRYDDDTVYSSKSLIVASPTSEKLAALLVKSLSARAEGSMTNAHVVFVGTPAEGRRVIEAANRSGARVTIIDRSRAFPPGEPLPDSPEPLWLPRPDRF